MNIFLRQSSFPAYLSLANGWKLGSTDIFSNCMVETNEEYENLNRQVYGSISHSSLNMDHIRDALLKRNDLISFHSGVNEILRHFWNSYSLKDPDSRAKNSRMTRLLEKLWSQLSQLLNSNPSSDFNIVKVQSSLRYPIILLILMITRS
jgi:hypothetical protein